jgi:hypothetical protein
MKSDITPETGIITPETLPATPRDESKGEWLRHATSLFGALGVASVLSAAAKAQDATAPPTPMTGTAPMDGTMPMTGTAPMDGTMPMTAGTPVPAPPTVQGTQPAPAQIDPTASQAVPGNSIVPDAKRNANAPVLTIPASGKTATASDIAILNFALGLEYLEAEYYARAVAAHQARPYLSDRAFAAAQKLAFDEAAHVSAIIEIVTAAKGTPVAKPAFKFPAAAFFSNLAFLDTATEMEETGVGAYLGAAPQVQSKNVLRFAASVYGIETRHTGLVRLLGGRTFAPNDIEIPLTVEEVTRRVAPFMA